jgi:hypothetical protein
VPSVAAVVTEMLAVIWVALATFTLPATMDTPVPAIETVEPAWKLVPVKVTGTVMAAKPRFTDAGLIVVSVGASTVKVVVAVRPVEVTVTVRAVAAAELEMANVVVMVVAVAVKAFTATPVPDTVTEVVPARFVPLMVTATVCPRSALLGVIPLTELMVGGTGVTPPNSKAPASMFGLPASGRTWPRKSSFGASV